MAKQMNTCFVFILNKAGISGGALFTFSSNVGFNGTSSFYNNEAQIMGGALRFDRSVVHFNGTSSFFGNTAHSGGVQSMH